MSSSESNVDPQEPRENEYTVGWICALQEEYEPACKMLDRRFKGPRMAHPNDDNTYEFGQISDHYVVIGCLPFGDYGTNSAAAVAKDMVRSFPKLRFALLVGIGGGAPTRNDDIRLGDVVVGAGKGIHGGIIQLDAVKRYKSVDGSLSTQLWRHLNGPPNVLLGALPKIQARYNDPDEVDKIAQNMERMSNRPEFERPSDDRLYRASYPHQGGSDCENCDAEELVTRVERAVTHRVVKVHYGTIGSSNSLMKMADERELYANDPDLRILCFEMEAAGLVNTVPCLVIRGICDYADSHKNDDWHNYAALAAAAYAKELLDNLRAEKVTEQPEWGSVLDEVKETVQELKKDFHQDQICRKLGELLSWIAKDKDKKWHEETNDDYYSKRHPGTGHWFENHPEFLAWVGGQTRTLLCHGPPGAGKSVIASIAIRYLQSIQNSHEIKCAYLYCNYARRDTAKQTDKLLLSVLLRQLCEVIGLPNLIKNYPRNICLSLEDISAALSDVVRSNTCVFVIIDALDECSPRVREALIKTMIQLQDRTAVRFMATSRGGFLPIKGKFRSCSVVHIKAAAEDVHVFIKDGLDDITHLDKNSLLRDSIPWRVARTAGSIFLLANFHLARLKDTDTEQDIQDCLDQLPIGPKRLETVYEEALKRIDRLDDTQRRRTYCLLSWVFHSRRSLTLCELEHALSVTEGDTQLNPRNIPDIHQVISRCEGLVDVNKKWGEVRFVHATVHQYFEDNPDRFERNGLTPRHIALVCVTYLSFDKFQELWESYGGIPKAWPFYKYAARNWGHHARTAGSQTETDKLVLNFIQNEAKVLAAANVVNGVGFDVHSRDAQTRTALHIASYFGLGSLVEFLLDNGVGVDAATIHGKTPMHFAINNGRENIVRLLIKRGASINFPCQVEQVLHKAIKTGNINIVNVLIEKGANVNALNQRKKTPLFSAVRYNEEDMMKLLLRHGADVNSSNTDGFTPLHKASCSGNERITKLLIEANANPCAQDKWGKTPLYGVVRMSSYHHLSSRSGDALMEIMKLLIKAGADPNAKDKAEDPTMLCIAIKSGQKNLVETLLDAGAHIDDTSAFDMVAMCKWDDVAMCKRDEIARILLKHTVRAPGHISRSAELKVYVAAVEGQRDQVNSLFTSYTDININDVLIQSALLRSAKKGHDAVVQTLLEAGVSIESKDATKRTALHLAAREGHDAVVQALLDAGVNIESKDATERTALHLAARGGHNAVVQALLDAGVNIESKDATEKTALHLAAREGHEEVVRILVTYGADVLAKSESYHRALYYATRNGNDAVAEILLNNGARVDEESSYIFWDGKFVQKGGGAALIQASMTRQVRSDINSMSGNLHKLTPLSAAAANGDAEAVGVLLEAGANIDACVECGCANHDHPPATALDWAVRREHIEVVKLLLDKGAADLHPRNEYGHIALYTAVNHVSEDLVSLLIRRGARDGAVNNYLRTALYHAVERGYEKVAQLLLVNGVTDPNVRNRRHGWTALHQSVYDGNKAMTSLLIRSGANVNARDDQDRTPLHIAAQCESAAMETLLQSQEINVNAVNNIRQTPLHYAARCGFIDGVKSLLECRASREVRDRKGRTPGLIAMKEGHEHLASLLKVTTLQNV